MKMIPLDGRESTICSSCKKEKEIKSFSIVQGRSFRFHKCNTCRSVKKKPKEVYVSRKERGLE